LIYRLTFQSALDTITIVNLKNLSERLNLSPTTVSRALNGYPEVSESTRARVLKAANLHGYRPSHHAQRLAAGKSHALAHIIPTSQNDLLGPHFADVVAGASSAAGNNGYELLFSVVDDAEQETAYRSLVASGRADGVIVHAPLTDDARIPLLLSLGIPFVVHGRSSEITASYHFLDVDNLRALRRATQLLIDFGHTRIALLNGTERWNYAARRRAGYLDALAANNIPVNEALMFHGGLTEHYGYQTTQTLLQGAGPVPTAIVSSGVLPAYGALRALQEHGLIVGQDISLITYDDRLSYFANDGEIPLFTSVRSSIRDAGARVVEMLVQVIEAQHGRQTTDWFAEIWEAELVIGSSTGPCPG